MLNKELAEIINSLFNSIKECKKQNIKIPMSVQALQTLCGEQMKTLETDPDKEVNPKRLIVINEAASRVSESSLRKNFEPAISKLISILKPKDVKFITNPQASNKENQNSNTPAQLSPINPSSPTSPHHGSFRELREQRALKTKKDTESSNKRKGP